MITAIVTFKLPDALTREQWSNITQSVSSRFQNVPGLIRKQFLFDKGIGGGVYLWESRKAADAAYNDAWRESIRRVAIAEPEIVFFETPVVVDNEQGQVRVAA